MDEVFDLDRIDPDLGMSWREWFAGYVYKVEIARTGAIRLVPPKGSALKPGGIDARGHVWGCALPTSRMDLAYLQYLRERRDAARVAA